MFDASTPILLVNAELLEAFLIHRLISEKKLIVEPLMERALFEMMWRDQGLGAGEAEAIALAVAKGEQLIATDDKKAGTSGASYRW